MTPPPAANPKKRRASVAAGQEFYQQQLRKQQQQQQPQSHSTAASSPARPRRRSSVVAAATPPRRRRRAIPPASATRRPAPIVVAVATRPAKTTTTTPKTKRKDDEQEETLPLDSQNAVAVAAAATASCDDESHDTSYSSRASKRRKVRHSLSPREETTTGTTTTNQNNNPTSSSEPAQLLRHTAVLTAAALSSSPPPKLSPQQLGKQFYQEQQKKLSQPQQPQPQFRVHQPRCPPSLYALEQARSRNEYDDDDPRLRRSAAPCILESTIPKESDAISPDDDDDETVPFVDAAAPEPETEPSPTTMTTKLWNKKKLAVLLLVVVVPVVVAVALGASPDVGAWCHKTLSRAFGFRSIIRPSRPSGPPCYDDFPAAAADTSVDETTYCQHHPQQSRTACPPQATCRGGVVVGCQDGQHLELVTADGTTAAACVLTPQARDTVHATYALLQKYSVHILCGGGGRHRRSAKKNPVFVQLDDEYGVPLFRYRPLAETYLQTAYDPDLLELANNIEELTFVLRVVANTTNGDDDDTEILVGLHPHHPLEIPLQCTIRNYVWMISQLVGAVLLGVLGILGSYLWDSLVSAPLQTTLLVGGGSLLVWWIVRMRHRNRAKHQRDLDVVNLRHLALSKLQQLHQHQQQQGVHHYIWAQHLCDELAWELHPRSHAQRWRLKHQLWPCVVNDLRTDSRVECSYDGSELVWQWRPHCATTTTTAAAGSSSGSSKPQARVQFA